MGLGLLQSEGITAYVADGVIAHVNPGITGASGGIRLLVREQDLAKAQEILDSAPEKFSLTDAFVPPEPSEEVVADSRDLKWSVWLAAFLLGGLAMLGLLGLMALFFVTMGFFGGFTLGMIFFVFTLGGLVGFMISAMVKFRRRK
ncbi:MAG: DUF2007 domain-containing protein [Lentisphaerota bacterium]